MRGMLAAHASHLIRADIITPVTSMWFTYDVSIMRNMAEIEVGEGINYNAG
jgi:hypothetical protein